MKRGGLVLLSVALALGTLFMSLSGLVAGATAPARMPHGVLQVTQRGVDAVYAGGIVTYTIWFTNSSGETLSNIQLQDTWNTNMAQISSPTSQWWTRGIFALFNSYVAYPTGVISGFAQGIDMASHSGYATWRLTPIAAGQSVQIIFSATVPITLQPGLSEQAPWGTVGPTVLGNSVVAVAPGQANGEANVVNTSVVGPLLRMNLTSQGEAAPTGMARVGRLLTYTLLVQNLQAEGSTQRPDSWGAENLVIGERLPESIRTGFITATAAVSNVQVSFISESGLISWTYPIEYRLMPSQSTLLTFTVRVPHNAAYNPGKMMIPHDKVAVQARTAGIPFYPANLYKAYNVRLLGPFDKTATTPEEAGLDPGETYPGRVITYTLTFYNPLHNTALDTLRIDDGLAPGYAFSDIVSGAQPTTIYEPGRNRIIWENLSVAGNGAISLTYRVTVPLQLIPTACSGGNYPNTVTATAGIPDFGPYLGNDDNKMAPLTIVPEIVLAKTVMPTRQLYGSLVTYTIKLTNQSERPITGPIVVTDTLPVDTNIGTHFLYDSMVSPTLAPGDPDVVSITEIGQEVVWRDVPGMAAGESFEFSFMAIADGQINKRYYNDVTAVSTATAFCPLNDQAGVTVDSPFRINKKALQQTVVQGELLQYSTELVHVSARGVFTLLQFRDELTPNLFIDPADGDMLYRFIPVPTVTLAPGSHWVHTFTVTPTGSGINTVWCEERGGSNKRLPQNEMTVRYRIQEPQGIIWHVNGAKLASVMVLPHASLMQSVYPTPVASGGKLTVTLSISDNRTTLTSPLTDITGIALKWTLPTHAKIGPLIWISSSITPTEISDGVYYWRELTLTAQSRFSIELYLQAPVFPVTVTDASLTFNSVVFVDDLDDPDICIPGGADAVGGKGIVLQTPVVQTALELSKKPNVRESGPYGEIIYTLQVNNKTGAPINDVTLTDVLPLDWKYLGMVAGAEPLQTNPLMWKIPTIPPNDKAELRFQARSYVRLRTETNWVTATCPSGIPISRTAKYSEEVGVLVRPGIGFFKDVYPGAVDAGQTMVYTITVYNAETFDLANGFITDTLPVGFTYEKTLKGDAIAYYNPNNPRIVRWRLNNIIKANQSALIVFQARVSAEQESGDYYNEAEIYAINNTTKVRVSIPATGPTAKVHVYGRPTIQVNKAVTPTQVHAGETLSYTITLRNEALESYPLVLTDSLPAEITLVAGTDTPSATTASGAPQQLVWRGLSIAPEETLTFTFQARASREISSGVYCNWVQVQMGGFVLEPSGPHACVTATEIPRVDAQIAQDDGVLWLTDGQWLTYTLHYTNHASSAAMLQNVVLTETLTPAAAVAEIGGTSWAMVSPGVYIHPVGSLAPGESGAAVFSVRLTHPLPADLLNLMAQAEIGYQVSGEVVEVSDGDNRATDVDLRAHLSKAVAPTTATAGNTVVYSLTLRNSDAEAWQAVRITDTLPLSFTYVSQSQGPGAPQLSTVSGQQRLVWTQATLAAGQETRIVFTARVDAQHPGGSAYNTLAAHASRSNGMRLTLPDPGPLAPVTVGAFPTAEKLVAPATLLGSGEVTYTVSLFNPGAFAYTARLTDTLPDGVEFVAAGTGPIAPVTYPGTPQRVVWSPLTLPAGEAATLTFRARVNSVGRYCNALALQVGTAVRTWSNLACVDSVSAPVVDAQITKSDGLTLCQAGQVLTYTLYYTNASNIALAQVVLTETLPAEAVDAAGGFGWRAAAGNVYTYAVGTLVAGAAGNARFVVRLANPLPTGLTQFQNQAEIGHAPAAAADAHPEDNAATDVDTIQSDTPTPKKYIYLPLVMRKK